jgi:hypothetical protein
MKRSRPFLSDHPAPTAQADLQHTPVTRPIAGAISPRRAGRTALSGMRAGRQAKVPRTGHPGRALYYCTIARLPACVTVEHAFEAIAGRQRRRNTPERCPAGHPLLPRGTLVGWSFCDFTRECTVTAPIAAGSWSTATSAVWCSASRRAVTPQRARRRGCSRSASGALAHYPLDPAQTLSAPRVTCSCSSFLAELAPRLSGLVHRLQLAQIPAGSRPRIRTVTVLVDRWPIALAA